MGIMNFIKKQKEIRKVKASKEYRQAELRQLQSANKERQENQQLDNAIRQEKKIKFESNKGVQIGRSIINNLQNRSKQNKKGTGIYGGSNIYTQSSSAQKNIFTSQNKNNVYAGQGFRNPFTGNTQSKTRKKQKTITIKI